MLPAHAQAAVAANGTSNPITNAFLPSAVPTQTPGIKRESATPLDSPATTTSPVTSARPTSTGNVAGIKRKHDVLSPSESAEGDNSPTGWHDATNGNESRIGVKRACNECRQQKVSNFSRPCLPYSRTCMHACGNNKSRDTDVVCHS